MTKRMRDDGTEVVYLGTVERWVAAAVATIFMALLIFIGHLVWQDHESIAGLKTDVAVIKAVQHSGEK